MNRLGLRAGLAPLAVLCFLLSGCASYYKVEIGGDRVEQIRSVFLIVSETNPLKGSDGETVSLVMDKASEYLLFAQYNPDEGMPLTWHAADKPESPSDLLKLEVLNDRRVIRLRINKKLLETYGECTFVAVGLGREKYYHHLVHSGKLRTEKGVRLDVGAAKFLARKL